MGLVEAWRHLDDFSAAIKQLQDCAFYEVLSLHLLTCFLDGPVLMVFELHLNISEWAFMFTPHWGEWDVGGVDFLLLLFAWI